MRTGVQKRFLKQSPPDVALEEDPNHYGWTVSPGCPQREVNPNSIYDMAQESVAREPWMHLHSEKHIGR